MSKTQINTKSSAYQRDKEAFLKDLKQFNDSKGIFYKPPYVNGIEIDLFHFYSLVQQRGGFSKVNSNDLWETFLRPLRLPYPCINGSTLLRKIYGMHLEKYERAKGPPSRDDDNDMEDDSRSRRGGIPRVTFGGGTYISASGEALRPGTRPIAGPSERLCLSLISPMPNEQDFAVNVCTVLAADHSNRLPLATTPHILDFLLAHAGVYNHSSLRDTIGRSYFESRGRYPDDFWKLRAGGGGARELADETKFMQPGLEQPELTVQALAAQNALNDCLRDESDDDVIETVTKEHEPLLEDFVTEPSEEDQLFAPELPGGASCVYTQRVLQIASIIRSLSFHEENVQYLAKNNTLVRFLLLCANCWVGTLRQSGLDALGNVSTELIIKDPATCLISRHVLSTIQSALVSPDRARVLAALELLNKLAQNEANEDALLKALEAKVYKDVCALLTLRDIMVLVCTLECVYALTSLGDRASEAVARVDGLVHTLVSLVTVEAQSYGPRACILMRVVETVSGPSVNTSAQDPSNQSNQSQSQPQLQEQLYTSSHPSQPPPQASTRSEATAPAPAPPPQGTAASTAPTTPAATHTAPAPAPATTIQQSHLQQRTVQENEHFAQAWLRSTYEALPASDNSACDAAEVYRQYLACCSKLGRKGVIASAHFPRLVRTVFGGTVGPNNITVSTGETQQAYIGIRAKNPPKVAAGPASPILKAQLTNKAGVVVEAKTVVSQAQPSQPHAQPQSHDPPPPPPTSNTSLIKHLLAHKVSPAPTMQVAQRQQNQQRPPSTVVVHNTAATNLEVDPEALIKCTTITSGGIASSVPAADESIVLKEEPLQMQIDEQTQLTIKTAQNKMLADLLEKKSNPPVQVVQMGPQINAPTIQITETGQIVQVKSESPVIQINPDSSLQSNQYYTIKNDQGQIIQIKNDQGQIIQLKNDQGQLIQLKNDQLSTPVLVKNEQGQIIQLKTESMMQSGHMVQGGQIIQGGQVMQSVIQGVVKSEKDIIEAVVTDHSYTEPPNKKMKVEDKRESNASPQESVSKTAANLYAALAASALEDEEDLLPPKQEEVIQQPVIVATSSDNPVIIQEPILQVQQPTLQVQQPTLQVQQPTLQVQQPTLQVQQLQQPLQMQQPMLQVQPIDVQNMMSQPGQIIIHEKPLQQQYIQQPMQIITAPGTSQGGLSYITQNIPGNMMQKTIIIVQGSATGGPLTLTVNNPGGLDEATLNNVIAQATEAITQQQIIQNSGVIQSTQRVIVSQPALVTTSQPITMVKTSIAQNTPQITPSQQPIITTQPQPIKAQVVNQPQIMVTNKNPPTLITSSGNQIITSGNQIISSGNQQIITGNQQIMAGNQQIISGNQQIMTGNQQIIQGGQQLLQGNQQIIAVSNNQQIMVNTPMKQQVQTVHRVVQPQRVASSQDGKTSVIQTNAKSGTRQVITRQPVMLGNTKIGEKEVVVTQSEKLISKPVATPPPQPLPQVQPVGPDDTPWICHWRGCGKVFEDASEVFNHAAKTHCPMVAGGEAPCLWLDCDRVPRKTFALLNHLTDKHCTPQALKAIFNSRRHAVAEAEAKPVTLAYPPNAALAALNKHAADMFNPRELMDENEGPVTKSIRLTAALILRNIVIYSNTGRRQLRSYEAHLATIAMSSVEASRTIAQVLYDMNNI